MNHLDKTEGWEVADILAILAKLWEQGKLEPSEISILKSLAEKNREAQKDVHPVTNMKGPLKWSPQQWNSNNDREQQNHNSEDVTAEHILEVLLDNKVHFWIMWTDWKNAWHHTQFTNFWKDKYWKLGLLDSPENIPENLRDDPKYLWVKFREDKDLGNKYVLLLRVADNRVDNRNGSHTTVFLLIPKQIEKSKLESLTKDVDGLKRIMGLIFEKAKSPLKWAELQVKQSLLVQS